MSVRFVLAPQAALDLVEIWRYIKEQTSLTIADRVESAIREKIAFLAGTPGAGHSRKDLTDEDVRFFPVYSYLIVYRPRTRNHCKSLPFFTDTVMWNGSSRAAYERWLPCSRQESSGRLAGAQADYSGLISVERVLRAIGGTTQVETSAILPACYLSNLHSRAIGPLM